MNEHSLKLLEECNSGCKMALESVNQIHEYIKDHKLMSTLDTYKRKHEVLEVRSTSMLEKNGRPEKKPNMMASAFSYITAEMKLMIKDDNHQVAKLLMDGCNMGIQSISTCRNDYPDADQDVLDLAEDLIKIEEDFMKDLKAFI